MEAWGRLESGRNGEEGRDTYDFKGGKENKWYAYYMDKYVHAVVVVGTVLAGGSVSGCGARLVGGKRVHVQT